MKRTKIIAVSKKYHNFVVIFLIHNLFENDTKNILFNDAFISVNFDPCSGKFS